MAITREQLVEIINSHEIERIEKCQPEELARAFSEALPGLLSEPPAGVGAPLLLDFWEATFETPAAVPFADLFLEKDGLGRRKVNLMRPAGYDSEWYAGLGRCLEAIRENGLFPHQRGNGADVPVEDTHVAEEPAGITVGEASSTECAEAETTEFASVADVIAPVAYAVEEEEIDVVIVAEEEDDEQPVEVNMNLLRDDIFYLIGEKDLVELWRGYKREDTLEIYDDAPAKLVSETGGVKTLAQVRIPA